MKDGWAPALEYDNGGVVIAAIRCGTMNEALREASEMLGIGSKEQDSAFWKEFRKAANAYANVQAKRICDLEHALAEEKKHRNKIEDLNYEITAVTAQRDALAEALWNMLNQEHGAAIKAGILLKSLGLQSLKQDHTVATNDMIAAVKGGADEIRSKNNTRRLRL